MSYPAALTLPATPHLSGEIALPGSKSISNRVLLLAALAEGQTRINNLLEADDTRVMLEALNRLGTTVEADGAAWIVHGQGGPFTPDLMANPEQPLSLNLGLAGTAYRPLTAALTLGRGEFLLDGIERMRERPIGDLVDALVPLGATIRYAGQPGYPPLAVTGTGLRGGHTRIRGDISSQFLTALLLAAPGAQHPVTVDIKGDLVSRPYIDITLTLMQRFGIQVTHDNYQRFEVPSARYQSPGQWFVEGDASSASYFLAAGAIAGPGVSILGLGSAAIQGDVAFIEVLRAMGAEVTLEPNRLTARPPASGQLRAVDLDLNHIPDAAMTAAVLALFADGTTHIRNIGNWRVKETDRLAAMATELRKVGARVTEHADAISITPNKSLQHASIATYGDHRMAMCFSLVALAGIPVTIEDPGCVAKTFPDYFETFDALSRRNLC